MLLLRSFRHRRHLGGKHKLLVDRSFSRLDRGLNAVLGRCHRRRLRLASGEAGCGCSSPCRRRILGSPQVPTALLLLWPWNSLLREHGGSRTGQIQASMGTSATFSHCHWSVGSGEWIGRGKRLDRCFLSPWSPGGGLIGLAALPCLAGWRLPLV